MTKVVVFIGAPGSGKGTQAKKLHSLGYVHVSTGDLLREEIKKQTDTGRQIEAIYNQGKLVSDEIVNHLIKINCDFKNGKYVFDGYPRNLKQAVDFDEILDKTPYQVIYFDIDQEELIKRLVERRSCPNCGKIYNLALYPPKKENYCDSCIDVELVHRNDDKKEVVEKRMQVFEQNTQPLLNFYYNKKNLIKINALENVEEVGRRVLEVLR